MKSIALRSNHRVIEEIGPSNLIQRLGRYLFSTHVNLVLNNYAVLDIKNKENIPDYPFIICGNHQSHLDGIILSHVANKQFEYTAMIAAKDYWFDNKAKHLIASLFFNIIPIDRKSARNTYNIQKTTKLVRNFLDDRGKAVVILPEGTRSSSNKIRPFKKGIVILSKSSGLPIVPVYLEGSGKVWPKGKWFFRPGKIHATVGKPIFPEELDDDTGREYIRKQVEALQNG